LISKSKIVSIIKFIAVALPVLNSAIYSFAQAKSNGTITATIIAPVSIEWIGNMNFGNIAVSPTVAGTVQLAPAGTFTTKGDVTLPANRAAASINLTGLGNSTYSITLPNTALNLTYLNFTMSASSFTSNPSTTGTLTAGVQTLSVGATLNVGAAQPPGSYVTTAFAVTVNYN
jgi:hypothetical protein